MVEILINNHSIFYYQAVEAARQAFQKWGHETTGKQRGELLRRWFEILQDEETELAKILTMEQAIYLKIYQILAYLFRENLLRKHDQKYNMLEVILIGTPVKHDVFMEKLFLHLFQIEFIITSENQSESLQLLRRGTFPPQ